jgi:phosphoribosylformylglycinamidine synthase subunit PurQ / glutaminase
MQPIEFLWNESLDKLTLFDGYIIIGGFSYEDRSRAGIIAALDPVIQEIKAQSEQGKPVLGICNGAQILVEAGMVPGLENNVFNMALTENKRIANGKVLGVGFYNDWVNIRLSKNVKSNAFTSALSAADVIHLPVAHAEGRFIMPGTLLSELNKKGLSAFQYCDAEGNVIDDFPTNPNGSIDTIAAITNKAGNVMAMMPHPERTLNGDGIFISMRDYITKKHYSIIQKSKPLVQTSKLAYFEKNSASYQCLIQLIITDNQALTVQKTLRKMGFPITVNRFAHWEIECDSAEHLDAIKKTGVLFCDKKEKEITSSDFKAENALSYLVRPRENILGQKTLQTLEVDFLIPKIKDIKHGVIWQFASNEGHINDLIDDILLTNIIRNKYAHECYQYDQQLFK